MTQINEEERKDSDLESLEEPLVQLKQSQPVSVPSQLREIAVLAIPAIFANLFTRLQATANVLFIGMTGSKQMMAGVGLGEVALAFFGQYFLLGMNNAIETLATQSAGAGNLKLAGIYLNRGRVILTIFMLPVALLFFQINNVLKYLGQDNDASFYAQIYATYFIPGLYMRVLADIQRKFLNSLGKHSVPMIGQAISSILHVVWCYIFIVKMDMGVVGTAIAGNITNSLSLLIMQVYANQLDDVKDAFNWPDSQSFVDLGKYLEIGIPCSILFCSSYCAINLLTLLTGFFSVDIQNAQIILINIEGIFFMVSIGLWQSVATIIGQKIGKLEVSKARRFYKTIKLVGLFTYLLLLIISQILNNQIVGCFTNFESIKNQALAVFFMMQIDIFPDLFIGINTGMVQALALQKRVLCFNFVSYWIVLPTCLYFFAFYLEMELLGIWLAKVVMGCFYFLSMSYVIETLDWDQSALDSHKRQSFDMNKLNEIEQEKRNNDAYFQCTD